MDSHAPAVSAPSAPNMALGTILLTSTIFVLFVVFALVILLLQYCVNNSARTLPSGSGGVLAASGARLRDKGVDPELLRSLPVTVYRAGAPSAGEDVGVECAVCLSELQDGETARFLPPCGHGFHAQCVDKWLASHTTCPLCRVTVAKPEALTSTGLPPVPPEPASYAANLPASVLLGVSDQATLTAATVTSGGSRPRPSALSRAAVLVIDIPEPRTVVAAPRDAAKTPGSARLRSLKRLWSFGRQGPSESTPSYSWGWGSGSGTEDTERGVGNACATPRAQV